MFKLMVSSLSAITDLSQFLLLCLRVLCFSCSRKPLSYLAVQSIDFEHIWWMFFNKVSCTLHYIYACFFLEEIMKCIFSQIKQDEKGDPKSNLAFLLLFIHKGNLIYWEEAKCDTYRYKSLGKTWNRWRLVARS